MAYSDNFAGLAQAVLDSGSEPTILVEFELKGITSISVAQRMWQQRSEPPELLSALEAVLITALGEPAVTAARAASQETNRCKRPRRTDLPVPHPSGGGNLGRALASAHPLRRAATLESFRADVWARSNIGPQDARWKTFCRVCPAWQIAPLPLCPNVVEKVAASFKAGATAAASNISVEPAANISSSS